MKALFINTLLCSCLIAQTPASKAPASKAPATKAPASQGAPAVSRGGGSLLNPASLKAKAPDTYKVQISTTKGDIVVEVHRDWAPIGADRFYNLVRAGYFTDAAFFRVLKGFVVQFGLSAKPAVSKAWQNANLRDDPVKQSNKKGTLTFATAGPNTRTTQIFINLADNASLDAQGFAAFGQVIEGMDAVEKLYGGYGDPPRGPDQQRITNEGKAYLDKNFPQLDRITAAKILPAAGAAPVEKK
jgi:peptidyl-prolyl cis-trans isomerase A (cyclophilin A)